MQHPNIVSAFALEEVDGLDLCIVMEYVEGTTLKEWLQEKAESDAFYLRNKTWLCSLSKVYDSILMWSHYCGNHKGVCIGLDMDEVKKSVPPMFGTI